MEDVKREVERRRRRKGLKMEENKTGKGDRMTEERNGQGEVNESHPTRPVGVTQSKETWKENRWMEEGDEHVEIPFDGWEVGNQERIRIRGPIRGKHELVNRPSFSDTHVVLLVAAIKPSFHLCSCFYQKLGLFSQLIFSKY